MALNEQSHTRGESHQKIQFVEYAHIFPPPPQHQQLLLLFISCNKTDLLSDDQITLTTHMQNPICNNIKCVVRSCSSRMVYECLGSHS